MPPPGGADRAHRAHVRTLVVGLLRALAATTVLGVAYFVFPLESEPTRLGVIVRVAISFVAIVALVGWQVVAVARSATPVGRAMEALVISVSAVVFAFAAVYLSLSNHDPASFDEVLTRISALYFTITTLATVGYGDIHAATDNARIVVIVQMVANVILIGAVARLIVATARRRSSETQISSNEP